MIDVEKVKEELAKYTYYRPEKDRIYFVREPSGDKATTFNVFTHGTKYLYSVVENEEQLNNSIAEQIKQTFYVSEQHIRDIPKEVLLDMFEKSDSKIVKIMRILTRMKTSDLFNPDITTKDRIEQFKKNFDVNQYWVAGTIQEMGDHKLHHLIADYILKDTLKEKVEAYKKEHFEDMGIKSESGYKYYEYKF